MKKIIKIIVLIVLAVVFFVSAFMLIRNIVQEKQSKAFNKELINKVVSENPIIEDENTQTEKIPIKVDFEMLKAESSNDAVGWLYCKDTSINYPVAQAWNNSYYLRRLINGDYNNAGTLFMDYRNSRYLENTNTVIYGHNMRNGDMFGELQNYKSQEFYNEHKEMYYLTEEKNYKLELIAGCTISNEASLYEMFDMNAYQKDSLLDNLKSESTFESDVVIGEDEKLMTLSTCAYEFEGARYIVIGVLREII